MIFTEEDQQFTGQKKTAIYVKVNLFKVIKINVKSETILTTLENIEELSI